MSLGSEFYEIVFYMGSMPVFTSGQNVDRVRNIILQAAFAKDNAKLLNKTKI